MFVMPNTKHIASRIFDLPDPFSPVIELKASSLFGCQRYSFVNITAMNAYHPEMTVRTAYDLKPCAKGQRSCSDRNYEGY